MHTMFGRGILPENKQGIEQRGVRWGHTGPELKENQVLERERSFVVREGGSPHSTEKRGVTPQYREGSPHSAERRGITPQHGEERGHPTVQGQGGTQVGRRAHSGASMLLGAVLGLSWTAGLRKSEGCSPNMH